MQHRPLGNTGLQIGPLVFGGNVFALDRGRRSASFEPP